MRVYRTRAGRFGFPTYQVAGDTDDTDLKLRIVVKKVELDMRAVMRYNRCLTHTKILEAILDLVRTIKKNFSFTIKVQGS